MSKSLDHAHLDMREKAMIQQVATKFQNNAINERKCAKTLVQMGYDETSVARYIAVLSSTCDDVIRRRR